MATTSNTKTSRAPPPEWTKIYDGTESSDATESSEDASTSTDRAGFVATINAADDLDDSDPAGHKNSKHGPKSHHTKFSETMSFPGLQPERQLQWEQLTIVSDSPPIGTGSQADIFVGYLESAFIIYDLPSI